MLLKAMMIQKPTKPISRNYAVKSDDDPKTNKKPISRNYAVKSDDDPKTNKNQYPGTMLLKAMMIQRPTKTNIPELCCKKR